MKNSITGLATGIKRKLALAGSAISFLLTAGISHAAVILSVTDTDGVPSVGSGDAGQPFSVNVKMTSTELTTGLTYFLQEDTFSGTPRFQIVGRDVTGSPFSDLTTSNPTALAPASALLDPTNNHDLGAGLSDVNSPLAAGTYQVAAFSILVLPGTPNGTYMIGFAPNSIAAGPGPNFPEVQVQRFSYTVATPSVPEPATASLLILGGLFLGTRTRFRKTPTS